MAEGTGYMSPKYWEVIDKSLGKPMRPAFVEENYKRFAENRKKEIRIENEEGYTAMARRKLERQEREKYIDQLYQKEKQSKEQEKCDLLEKSRKQRLQQDRNVQDFNRALTTQVVSQENKELAEYRRKRREAEQKLARQNDEFNPWHYDTRHRMEIEAKERKKKAQASVKEWFQESSEKKAHKQMQQELDRAEREKVKLWDAESIQNIREEKLKYKQIQKQAIEQNILQPKPPKKEQLKKAQEEVKQLRHKQNEIYLTQSQRKKDLEDGIRKYEKRNQIVFDQLAEIKKEKAASLAFRERQRVVLEAERLAKEEQREITEKEEEAAKYRRKNEDLTAQIEKNQEVRRLEKMRDKNMRRKLFEEDKLYEILKPLEKLERQKPNARYDADNIVLAAERRAKRKEFEKKDDEEKMRVIRDLSTVPDAVEKEILPKLRLAEEMGINVATIKRQTSRKFKDFYSLEPCRPSKFLDPLTRHDTDQTRRIKFEQAAKNRHFMLPGRKPHFLTPLNLFQGEEKSQRTQVPRYCVTTLPPI